MSDKTKVILKSKDGRSFETEFDSYEAACAWVCSETAKNEINLRLESARFDREPTIEIYRETPGEPEVKS